MVNRPLSHPGTPVAGSAVRGCASLALAADVAVMVAVNDSQIGPGEDGPIPLPRDLSWMPGGWCRQALAGRRDAHVPARGQAGEGPEDD
jgi:hypothetical protein